MNGLENFWAMARSRLVKFHGFSRQCSHRHPEETEFRFNHRQEKIYELLLHEFRKLPL
jgi:transposase-like protein